MYKMFQYHKTNFNLEYNLYKPISNLLILIMKIMLTNTKKGVLLKNVNNKSKVDDILAVKS